MIFQDTENIKINKIVSISLSHPAPLSTPENGKIKANITTLLRGLHEIIQALHVFQTGPAQYMLAIIMMITAIVMIIIIIIVIIIKSCS